MKLSILQITHTREIESGGPFQALQLAQGLSSRGHRVTMITRPSPYCERAVREAGVNLRMIPLRHELDFPSMFQLYRLMKEENTEVVHVHKGLTHTLAYLPSRRAKVPAFVVNRGVIFPLDIFNRSKYHWKGVGGVVTVAEEIRQNLITNDKLSSEKVVTIYGGTDLGRFDWRISGDPIRREFNIQKGHILIGMVANIRPWKGHRYFLEAVYPLLERYDKLRVMIVGRNTGKLGAALMKEAAEKGFKERIIFTGYREDIPQILAALDFSVISSYDGEGLTGTIRESLALKKPVISARVGGNAEIIDSGINGLLVPPRDVSALRSAIERMITSPGLLKKMGEKGLELIKLKFSLDARLDRMEEFYYRLVAENTINKRKPA